ncbi:hypothetical protein Vretimale_12275 [Volvox reticuliferus]|uniref:Uncharacterized protein n=1 Tax=Volvox reticuliferus TaxID=1737510 RepID=A0A8J4LSU5_9CHLO|nr:hypothetical protein Vretimale_12275 [Volvox reticuliferus]
MFGLSPSRRSGELRGGGGRAGVGEKSDERCEIAVRQNPIRTQEKPEYQELRGPTGLPVVLQQLHFIKITTPRTHPVTLPTIPLPHPAIVPFKCLPDAHRCYHLCSSPPPQPQASNSPGQ